MKGEGDTGRLVRTRVGNPLTMRLCSTAEWTEVTAHAGILTWVQQTPRLWTHPSFLQASVSSLCKWGGGDEGVAPSSPQRSPPLLRVPMPSGSLFAEGPWRQPSSLPRPAGVALGPESHFFHVTAIGPLPGRAPAASSQVLCMLNSSK